jgi:hypothetical protein
LQHAPAALPPSFTLRSVLPALRSTCPHRRPGVPRVLVRKRDRGQRGPLVGVWQRGRLPVCVSPWQPPSYLQERGDGPCVWHPRGSHRCAVPRWPGGCCTYQCWLSTPPPPSRTRLGWRAVGPRCRALPPPSLFHGALRPAALNRARDPAPVRSCSLPVYAPPSLG